MDVNYPAAVLAGGLGTRLWPTRNWGISLGINTGAQDGTTGDAE